MTGKLYSADGQLQRPDSAFRNFISKDPNSKYPPEKGRYALYLAPHCPWAHRTLIVRALKGLEDIIDVYQVHHFVGPEGWAFTGENTSLPADPIHGYKLLRDLYHHADPDYSGRYSVPVLWDKKTDTLVSNESSEIFRMFYTEFDDLLPEELREENRPGQGLYPEHLRGEIDAMNDWVYNTVNNGVYKTGLAKSQEAYEANLHALFNSLDRLDGILAGHGKSFLLGDYLTEADVRLYTTMVRFDVSYVPVFLCNLKTIRHDYPYLHLWLRRLYWDAKAVRDQTKGAFMETTQPFIARYAESYSRTRHKNVFDEQGPLIMPAGPAVLMEPLPE